MNYAQGFFSAILAFCVTIPTYAQEDQSSTPPSPNLLRAQAIRAMQAGDRDAATKSADKLLDLKPNDPTTLRLVGDVYLRCGDVDSAVEQFDRYLELEPSALPGLWQRGIALYFAGKYEAGVEQFEVHRRVNPNDVENAAWHFLCVAKARSFDEAKKLVLPAPNDPRIPMDEVLKMLSDGDTEKVALKMDSIPTGSANREDADFYGNFYLGLYADAEGDETKALRYLKQSAKDVPHHYMGDVARVYVTYLEAQTQSSK